MLSVCMIPNEARSFIKSMRLWFFMKFSFEITHARPIVGASPQRLSGSSLLEAELINVKSAK